ncbi:MAG: ATP-dependent RecD-like DNA helicase, partial [Limisphaerales bacterium]
PGATHIATLGVLEYIHDWRNFLRQLRAFGLPVVLSYCPTDFTSHLDRKALGWVNHISLEELCAGFAEAGFHLQSSMRPDSNQVLLRIVPAETRLSVRRRVLVMSYNNWVKRELLRGDFIKEQANGREWFTTNEVLAEEQRLIKFVQNGRGKFRAFPESYDFQNEELSDEQRNAVSHVLRSTDRVIAIRGGAGTGKTTMMKEAVAAIESAGFKVFTFAPSAEAARGVLRLDAGFVNAETVEMLLQNSALQKQVQGQVIWIDEAGLVSVRTLARVADLAERENCRVILSGDTAQHRAVERGDALRILENHAGLKAAELTEIRRQKAEAHKNLVADLRGGNLESAFKRLDALGMLRELPSETRHEALAGDYAATIKRGKSALVISPTHAEGDRVTRQIRLKLKAAKRIGVAESEFLQLKNLQLTEAQRADGRNYVPGMVVQFHQNVVGFQRGERVTVSVCEAGCVFVRRNNGEIAFLALEKAARFQVYESRRVSLAPGDMIRIAQNGFTKDRKRINNGDLKQIKGFTKQGDIELINGWVIPADYGNLTHGYCVTSYSAQSKGVDCVFVAESSESFRAADREQFYVSASRFKEALTIYTDDKGALLDAVNKTSQRPSATDLVKQAIADEQTANRIQAIVPDLRGQSVCISEQTCEKAKPDQAADTAPPEDDKQRAHGNIPPISPRQRARERIRRVSARQNQSYGVRM